jgi:beta-N-acetylhexosaminidase
MVRESGRHMPRTGAGAWSGHRRQLDSLLLALLALAVAACAPPTLSSSQPASAPPVPAPPVARGSAPPLPRQLSLDDLAAQMVGRMSLDDKLGQMIVIQFTDTSYTPQQQAMVAPFHPGGVILYAYAMGSEQDVRDLLASAQHDSPIPMFTFTDEEGGYVDRLNPYLGWRMSAPQMAATGDPSVAEQEGEKAAHDLLSFGINADLAPVTDVAVVMGPDQWGRTFGSTADQVTTYAGAWLAGLQHGGVVGSLKHFPGLGAATTDAHTGLPVIDRTRAEIESTELAPYRALIDSGEAQMVMSTDELLPALDPQMPAEISKPIITGILRDELHFDGVAVTDALYMQGITDHWSFAQAAVLAIEAGNDMIMAPWQPAMVQNIINGLKYALTSGQLSMAQVDNSVRRILALKMRYHLLPTAARAGSGPLDGSAALGATSDGIALDADLPHPPAA